MRNINARILALLLWLKARYEFLASRPIGKASLLLLFIGIGFLLIPTPAHACGITEVGCWVKGILISLASIFISLFSKLIAVVLEYMIPVMLYNSFSTSPVVTQGWALVRDTVNMFFVIVLIVIAFGTIFGHSKFKWQQQVPKLLIFAIVINFSKTLAGIMIDFGQVIMLTFANALREIAAGNIIEMFGLNKVSAFASSAEGQAAADWDLVFAAMAGVFITAWVLVIMILFLAILIYRVVALWILIVVAPLAWFAGGAKDILQSNAYADWWAQFKCLVAIGPVITFFLWLALSVAGAGADAVVQGFDKSTVGNSAGFLTEIFEFQHLMSMIIGSAMLLAGMQTAQQICSVMGNTFLGKTLGKAAAFGPGALQFGKGAALKMTGWGARKTGAGVHAVGRGTARGLGMAARSGFTGTKWMNRFTPESRADRARKVSENAGTGVIGRWRARRNTALAEKLEGRRAEKVARVGEEFKKQSAGVKAGELARLAQTPPGKHRGKVGAGIGAAAGTLLGVPFLGTLAGGAVGTAVGGAIGLASNETAKNRALALFADALKNKDVMKELEKDPKTLQALWSNYGSDMEQTYKGDTGMEDKINGFKKKNAHVTGSASELKTSDDFKDLSVAAMNDTDVQDQMRKTQVDIKQKGGPTKSMNAMAAAAAGHFGKEKQNIALGNIGGLDTASLGQIDTKTLMSKVGASQIGAVGSLAVDNKNLTQVQQIVSGLVDKHDDPNTSKSDKNDIAAAILEIANKLDQSISKKEGSPRYLARAETLQSMIRRDSPVPLPATAKETEKKEKEAAQETEKKEKEAAQIVSKISEKEGELEGAGKDVAKRMEINDEITSLKEALGSLDLSPLVEQLSSLESRIEELSGSLSTGTDSDAESGPSQAGFAKISTQLETLISHAEKQVQLSTPKVNTGLEALKEKFTKVMQAGGSSTSASTGTGTSTGTPQNINVDELKEALSQFGARLKEQKTLMTTEIDNKKGRQRKDTA